MKINRFIALAAIALLVVAAMGFVSTRSSAQTGTPPQAQITPVAEDKAEPPSGPDTDTVEEQVGDQSTADQPEAAIAPEADTGPDEKSPSYTGSITVTEATRRRARAKPMKLQCWPVRPRSRSSRRKPPR